MSEKENNQMVDILQENKPEKKLQKENTYNIDNLTKDLQSAKIISPAYAGRLGELNAILEYIYQATIFENLGNFETAKVLRHIAMDEMEHFELLAKTLIRLGVAPIYTMFPPQRDLFYTTRYVNYCTDANSMLKISIQGEEIAIKEYTKMLTKLKNDEVKNIISHILEQEKRHKEELEILQSSQN